MIHGKRDRRGVAILVALGVMAVLVVYVVTLHTSLISTLNQRSNSRREMVRRAGAESLLARASAWSAPETQTLETGGETALRAEVGLRPLAADDALWGRTPGLASLPGDALVTVRWLQPGTEPAAYLINREGRRSGAVLLPATVGAP
jgi:hypothetical protein